MTYEMTYEQIYIYAEKKGEQSGKTILDYYINNNYNFFLDRCKVIINKEYDKSLASDLFAHCIDEIYRYYNLNKITQMLKTEKRIFYYIEKILHNQYFTWSSSFNRVFRKNQTDELPFDIDFEDDSDDIKSQKEKYELKIDCLYNGIDHIAIFPEHKRWFYKYLFTEIVIKHKTPNKVAKEMGVANGTIYNNFNDLKAKLNAYYQKKCKFI